MAGKFPGFAVAFGLAAPAMALAMLIGEGVRSGEVPESPSGISAADGMAELENRELAGLRVVVGFEGTSPPRWLVRSIERGEVGGVILFSENVSSREQVARLTGQLQQVERPSGIPGPLLVMTDQEGGLVKRIPGAPRRSAAEIAAARVRAARHAGRATARNLEGVGVNVDLAPVMDVAWPGSNVERDERSFGRKPGKVSRLAGAFFHNLQKQGVAATAKHFPGFGAARVNTDFEAVSIDASRHTLRHLDEAPFRDAAERGIGLVMLSMAVYPALDPDRPAALSAAIAGRELRRRAGFEGVSITDSLDTPTATQYGDPRRLARLAARAGVDLLLFAEGSSGLEASGALRRSLRRGKLERGRFEASAARVLELREWLSGR